jgi:hypothetical protein
MQADCKEFMYEVINDAKNAVRGELFTKQNNLNRSSNTFVIYTAF